MTCILIGQISTSAKALQKKMNIASFEKWTRSIPRNELPINIREKLYKKISIVKFALSNGNKEVAYNEMSEIYIYIDKMKKIYN
jgi:hypothetical protein